MTRRLTSKSLAVFAIAALLLVLIAGLVVACGEDEPTTTTGPATTEAQTTTTEAETTTTVAETTTTLGPPQELTVSAASSLRAAFTDIGALFDAANNAVTTFNFDASGTLQTQIESGAPVDVFASAAMKQMNALVDGGFVDATAFQVFAGNEIVIIVLPDSTLGITSFEDLTKPEVKKIAYGDPAAAPHGVAAEEILNTLGIFDQVKPKVIYAANVAQTLEYVVSGEVDAGIMFSTEYKTSEVEVKVAATSEPDWHSTIAYPVGVVKASKNQELAQAFVEFVMSADGQAVLAEYGFLPPPAE
jgi:molybdate transport system substrate-binding protein